MFTSVTTIAIFIFFICFILVFVFIADHHMRRADRAERNLRYLHHFVSEVCVQLGPDHPAHAYVNTIKRQLEDVTQE